MAGLLPGRAGADGEDQGGLKKFTLKTVRTWEEEGVWWRVLGMAPCKEFVVAHNWKC